MITDFASALGVGRRTGVAVSCQLCKPWMGQDRVTFGDSERVHSVTSQDMQRVSGESKAGELLAKTISPDMLDVLVADAQANGGSLGVQELLSQMTKAVLERALDTELTHHLGYEKGDPDGAGTGNSRNGRSPKTVSTVHGPVTIGLPRVFRTVDIGLFRLRTSG